MAYFERTGTSAFLATKHTGGAWNPKEQHIAPAMGLLVHVVELDRDARGSQLVLGRFSYDILGTVPIAEVSTRVSVLRPGRTIELVEASLAYDGRDVLRLRAWLMQTVDTSEVEGVALQPIPGPEELPPARSDYDWPGGFIASVEVRRHVEEPGRGTAWVRSLHDLIEDEPSSRTARRVGLLDIANGMAVRAAPTKVTYPNIDLTAHLFAEPEGDWLGLDTRVSFGAGGRGLTVSVIHDERLGPIGTLAQMLTLRPVGG